MDGLQGWMMLMMLMMPMMPLMPPENVPVMSGKLMPGWLVVRSGRVCTVHCRDQLQCIYVCMAS